MLELTANCLDENRVDNDLQLLQTSYVPNITNDISKITHLQNKINQLGSIHV